MGLRIEETSAGQAAWEAAVPAVIRALVRGGRAALLVAGHEQALGAQRHLASVGLSLGVTVTTPRSWADERWEVWGDGRRVATSQERVCVLRLVLAEEGESLPATPGMLATLADIARDALPWLPLDEGGGVDETDARSRALTSGERAVLATLGRYARRLGEAGLVERCEAMALLPGRIVRPEPLVLAGFPPLPLAERELACALAARADVTVVLEAGDGPAGALARTLEARLEARAAVHGAPFELVPRAARAGGALPASAAAFSGASVALHENGSTPSSSVPAPAGAASAPQSPAEGASPQQDACPSAPAACGGARAGGAGAELPHVGAAAVRLQASGREGGVEEELVALGGRLFRTAPGGDPLHPTGAVRLLEPAGPLAEWELVAREACRLAAAGAAEVTVAVADAAAAWRGLAPKLAARGLEVSCSLARPAASLPAVRAFVGFARAVARLAALAEGWPAPLSSEDGPVPQLGDMSWWPPRELTDFLESDVSSVPRPLAHALDARWRSNRSLTPAEVLGQLQRESLTSRPVAQATSALLRGRVATAATALDHACADVGAQPRLACVAEVARQVGGLGVGLVGTKAATRTSLSLSELVELVAEVVDRATLPSRLRLSPAGEASPVPQAACPAGTTAAGGVDPSPAGAAASPCQVRICSRSEAAALAARSVDALIACNLTVDEWPLSPADGAAPALLERLGIATADDGLELARAQLARLVAAPRRSLVLERTLADAAAHPRYPAMALSELLACYGLAPGAVPEGSPLAPATLAELGVSANLSATATTPAPSAVSVSAPAGVVGPAAAGMVIVPREGQAELPGGRPQLSASQIESYLECPYKWFALRRLGLGDVDATFSALQMGSFAHRVLEVARTGLLRQAAVRAGLVAAGDGAGFDPESLPAPYVPGSAIREDTVGRARALVSSAFDLHLAHQRMSATTLASQSLVPHTATEAWRLELLRQDLLSTLDFEATRLAGFEVRHFELRFGSARSDARRVTYAGADFIGSVDRVDVDAHGRAVVIDYKHKARAGFAAEYDAFPEAAPASPAALVLPRRVQSLIYAQVVRRLFPELKVVGAVYLSTMGRGPADHEIAGALDAGAAEQVMGEGLADSRLVHLVAGAPGQLSFPELLDECERRVAEAIGRMVAGDIVARPAGPFACAWCPVTNCERRLG